jgi:hypothetical protein
MHRFDVGDLIDVGARFAPGEEAPAGVEIGGAGVRVLDRDGEEFEEAARAVVADGGQRQDVNANSFGFGPSHFAERDCHAGAKAFGRSRAVAP